MLNGVIKRDCLAENFHGCPDKTAAISCSQGNYVQLGRFFCPSSRHIDTQAYKELYIHA